MASDPTMARNTIEFGRFSLDLTSRRLSCSGDPIKLSSRALDILCELAVARGEVVDKDRLLKCVWGGRIVEENAIQVHVSALRKSLVAGSDGQSYIVTVPGRGYRLVGIHASAPPKADLSAVRSKIPGTSVAVLRFINLSGDPEQDYFADGIVEDIITGLSRIGGVFVIASKSSFVFDRDALDFARIGRELSCRYLVRGSVRKADKRIRITARLVEAETGVSIWAERYDRRLDDIFEVQDAIAMSLIGAIEPNLPGQEAATRQLRCLRSGVAGPVHHAHDNADRCKRSHPTSAKGVAARAGLCGGACASLPLLSNSLQSAGFE
jgi:TolB-like protein